MTDETGKDARMRVCLFEDEGAFDLEPLTLTRPVFDLWCGATTLLDKWRRIPASTEIGAWVRDYLVATCVEQHPECTVNDFDWLSSQPIMLVNARWLPSRDFDWAILNLGGPCIGTLNGTVAFASVTPCHFEDCTAATWEDALQDWKHKLPRHDVGGKLICRPWDVIEFNAEQLVTDFLAQPVNKIEAVAAHLDLLGPAPQLRVASTAIVEPNVVADTRKGPILIDHGAIIGAFTRLEGPCYIGPNSQVLGAKIRGGTTLGPNCRIGGEIEASIVQGNSNKYHDGFLGHSYIGEWVNIGAGAHTSDLRHDYGEVIVTIDGLRVPTGSAKVGSFVGDHSKIGLGCLLNSGTMIGVFAGVLPAGKLLPKNVPSFCAVHHGEVVENDNIESLFATAEEVMRRRDVPLTPAQLDLYRHICAKSVTQRQQVKREDTTRRLRRSA